MDDSNRRALDLLLAHEIVTQGQCIPFDKEELGRSVPERFTRVVSAVPDQPAIKSNGRILTYEALDRASNRVARFILAQRGQESEPIALLLEHGVESIIALLGVLKAGKGYVGLHPSSPPPKLVSILQDSQAGLILTDNENLSLATELAQDGQELMNIDEIGDRFSDEKVKLSIPPDTLAAIFYTSGSTGKPKGVERNHHNILYVGWRNAKDYHIRVEDHCSLLFFFGLGVSTANIYGSLLNGAALYPYNPQKAGLDQLSTWLIQEEITLLSLPVTLYRELVGSLNGGESFSRLRLIQPMGQALYKQDVESFKKHSPPRCILVNGLGSTEAGVVSRFFADHETEIAGRTVPIGYSLPETEVLILDENCQDVGLNRVGEIAMRSRHHSPGYWRKPTLTQEVFLPDPEGGDRRICRTGDRGIMHPDGCLEILGRGDFQVKIRGHRVELGEVEAVLVQHPAVRETVAIAQEADSSEKTLAAYIVIDRERIPTVSEVSRFMREKLPEYMVPSHFVILEEMPLTPSGKVDRQLLPEPESVRPELAEDFIPPRNDLELRLTQIWEEVIGKKPIGVRDDFFELGGRSLLAVRLFADIQKTFATDLPLATILQASTVEQLAEILRQEEWSAPWSSLVPIQPHGSKQPFFCVHPRGGNVLCYADLARHLGQDQPFYGLQAQGLREGTSPHTRIEDMADHYIKEIQAIKPEGPYLLGGMCLGGMVAYEMAQQLKSQDQEVASVFLIDTINPASYLKPLLRGHYAGRFVRHLRSGQLIRALMRNLIARTRKKTTLAPLDRSLQMAQSAAFRSYVPRPYSGRVTFFWASESSTEFHNPRCGWSELITDGLDIHAFPGEHDTMLKEPYIRFLAKQLGACLDEAQMDISDVDHQ